MYVNRKFKKGVVIHCHERLCLNSNVRLCSAAVNVLETDIPELNCNDPVFMSTHGQISYRQIHEVSRWRLKRAI